MMPPHPYLEPDRDSSKLKLSAWMGYGEVPHRVIPMRLRGLFQRASPKQIAIHPVSGITTRADGKVSGCRDNSAGAARLQVGIDRERAGRRRPGDARRLHPPAPAPAEQPAPINSNIRACGVAVSSMDVTFNNVLEGTRQYFMGLPTGSSTQAGIGPGPTAAPDSMLAPIPSCNDSNGASALSPRPSSTALTPSSTITTPASATTLSPPRPPSEPLEPEPHIIHKATVMREALEKRRECLEPEDEDDAIAALSPPSHIIRKPPHALPSPAAMPTAPSPLPVRPPSTANAAAAVLGRSPAPTPPHVRTPTPRRMRSPDTHSEPPPLPLPSSHASSSPYQHQYHTPVAAAAVSPARDAYPAAHPLDHYTGGRPPDPYSMSRPPEIVYPRYHYDTNLADNRNSILSNGSPQPSAPLSRQSPQQTYSRLSSAVPQHAGTVRLREAAVPSPPAQRYSVHASQLATTSTQPLNDRVPPIHHPSSPMTSTAPCMAQPDSRSTHLYVDHRIASQRTSHSSFSRPMHYERHSPGTLRKYDAQQAYPGYRPSVPTSSQSLNNLRIETQHQLPLQYKHVGDTTSAYYPSRLPERSRQPDLVRPHGTTRLPPPHTDYPHLIKSSEDLSPRNLHRNTYTHATSSTPGSRFAHNTAVVTGHNSPLHQRNLCRPESSIKSNQEYVSSNQVVQSSPTRSSTKSGYPAQQSRLTVSVTSLVNQMNQTKQKRESPLDLSVKTVKNSADSSTTQEDIELTSVESKNTPLPSRSSLHGRHVSSIATGYVSSHKVDFAPDFHSQYRDRMNHGHNSCISAPSSSRYNGAHNNTHVQLDSYKSETRPIYGERSKYAPPVRHKYPVSRIDLTRPIIDERPSENRLRDDRNIVIENNRKRLGGPVVSNIPEKIVKFETWSSDSRIDRINWSAREQQELMSRPVYSYSSHKRLEAYHSEQKRPVLVPPYKDTAAHSNTNSHYKYTYPTIEPSGRDSNSYHSQYLDKNQQSNVRQVIQKLPNHKDISSQHYDHRSGIPADKRVLSILRNSLETKNTGYVEPARPAQQIPDLIVIDDVDDSVIEITDLTKDNDADILSKNTSNVVNKHLPTMIHKIHVPRAIDSISNDMDYQSTENSADVKSKSPENDVASRIRTKAELKVLPPSQDNANRIDVKLEVSPEKVHLSERAKLLPKSQKQHLFNQIREDNLRLESVIKSDKLNATVTEIKSEPMNIDEIEKDAIMIIKTEKCVESNLVQGDRDVQEDMDWANACDMFMEQLKTGCHRKRNRRKHTDTEDGKTEDSDKFSCQESINDSTNSVSIKETTPIIQAVSTTELVPVIKQEPVEEEFVGLIEGKEDEALALIPKKVNVTAEVKETKLEIEEIKTVTTEISCNENEEISPVFIIKKETPDENEITKKPLTQIKEECESTDDDEPLIKSKLLKEKERNEQRLKYQLLKDLSEKSAYVKLECCDADLNKSIKMDQPPKEQDANNKSKEGKQTSRVKSKSIEKKTGKQVDNATSDSDDEVSVACRLRTRKSIKNEEDKIMMSQKILAKGSPSKKQDSLSNSTPIRKPGLLEGSNFYPGWEEELYRYKRSLRMPTRLIAIPRGRSGGPFAHSSSDAITRGSTSLPDLDPAPLSPAPSSAPSAATDDIFARRQDKLTLDSDLESNSSSSVPNRLHYDSEASTSTVFSTQPKKKGESILDVLIQKYGKKEETKKRSKEDTKPKSVFKTSNAPAVSSSSNPNQLNNDSNETFNIKKDKQKNHVSIDSFDNKSGNLKSKSKTENRLMKQRVLVKEVFGDERPASAPPASGGDDKVKKPVKSKNEPLQPKKKFKKNIKTEIKKKAGTIRDGLRSTKSLKRNDAKGRLLRLKKRNHIMRSFVNKKMKDTSNRQKKDIKNVNADSKQEDTSKESGCSGPPDAIKRRYRRLFGRRKFSSGFDYIRKKKKTIVRDESIRKVRKNISKPSPESVNDIHKEIKSWFINKSVGETCLHRAARLGYMDCVAYCLEKLSAEPSARDNAGFTPLHVAASRGHVRIARLLLQYGANVSAAAQGGIRPLHEACENSHLEMIRLLLAYGADPVLGTYSGQTPVELAEGAVGRWLRLHIADVQGQAVEPWKFHSPAQIIDPDEVGCDPLLSPPPASPPPTESVMEFQCTDVPLPPFYSLHASSGQPIEGLWCVMQDLISLLQIKSKESLLKQIHCGSGSPKELLRELRTQEFLEHAQCHQLLGTGEKVNVRASKVSLIRVTDKLRQLLNIETVLVS
ncbi:BCL-6 corepressor-like protein 1 [Eumeta japonica]|uniref:BCL-6 corepressor-like protein 1 n=1 Tax=Eumeta variegata TaxID=151549 RepID=A0A4C1WTW5_EUMVA|nr:BCL-6 corepressor-like protein 1 [Eumeta japonica]